MSVSHLVDSWIPLTDVDAGAAVQESPQHGRQVEHDGLSDQNQGNLKRSFSDVFFVGT